MSAENSFAAASPEELKTARDALMLPHAQLGRRLSTLEAAILEGLIKYNLTNGFLVSYDFEAALNLGSFIEKAERENFTVPDYLGIKVGTPYPLPLHIFVPVVQIILEMAARA